MLIFGSLHPSLEVGNKYKNTAFPRAIAASGMLAACNDYLIIVLLAMIEVSVLLITYDHK